MDAIDKRLYDVIWAEAGGGPADELNAVASVYLNRIASQGYEKALRGSSAYRKRSDEYVKASSGKMTAAEKLLYMRNQKIIDNLVANPSNIMPFTHHENVKAFGPPPWEKDMEYNTDIGRQRFYVQRPNPRQRAIINSNAVASGNTPRM